MAKYTINNACGHGTHEVALFGPTKERERKLAWYEETHLCPECYKIDAAKQAEKMGLILAVSLFAAAGTPYLLLDFSGNTMPVKDELKALGYRFGEAPAASLLGLLATSATRKSWYKCIYLDLPASADTLDALLQAQLDAVASLEPKLINKISPLDYANLADAMRKADADAALAQAKAAKIAALDKPVCPEILRGCRWNGKIYGVAKYGYRIYLDSAEIKLTAEQHAEITAYTAAKAAYNDAKRAIEAN